MEVIAKGTRKKKSYKKRSGKQVMVDPPLEKQMRRKRKLREQGESSYAKKKKRVSKKEIQKNRKEKIDKLENKSGEIQKLSDEKDACEAAHHHLPPRYVPYAIQRLLKVKGRKLRKLKKEKKNLEKSIEKKE